MTDKVTETVTIAAEDVGLRLDRVLATHIATLSRSHLKTLILAGQVTIAARTIRDPAATVKSGDTITVTLPPPEPALPKGETIPLNIIYEDDAIIVIDKPRGPCRPPGCRSCLRHAGQRADRPLWRKPVGDRRDQTARHRPPAR